MKSWFKRKTDHYKDVVHRNDGSVELVVNTNKYGLKSIIIDKEDIERVMAINWGIIYHHRVFYAQAWCRKHPDGRRRVGKLHQFILGFPGGILDHKNGDGLDNRKQNLRVATNSQNAANAKMGIGEKVPWKGVSFIPNKRLFCVQLSKDGKVMKFGSFKNPLLAAAKYNEMAIKLHGEFARLNEFTEDEIRQIQNPPKETRRKLSNNVTGYIGVSLKRKGYGKKRFIATIYVDGKNKSLGLFMTAEEAAKAYDEAAKKYKGGKASLNFRQ